MGIILVGRGLMIFIANELLQNGYLEGDSISLRLDLWLDN